MYTKTSQTECSCKVVGGIEVDVLYPLIVLLRESSPYSAEDTVGDLQIRTFLI